MDPEKLRKMVQMAADRIKGATTPVALTIRDVAFRNSTITWGFTARDAVGDPISFVVGTMDEDLVMLAAYDGKLSEANAATNLTRERVRRIDALDIQTFAQNTLSLLQEGLRFAAAQEKIRTVLAGMYDYDFR